MTQSERIEGAALAFTKLCGKCKVSSLANGTLLVEPEWPGSLPYDDAEGGGPGLLSRLAGAVRLSELLEACAALKAKRSRK